MAQQQQSPISNPGFNSMAWQATIDFFNGLMLLASLTVMVFARRKVGFRLLQPTRLIGMAAVVLFFAYFCFHAPVAPFGMAPGGMYQPNAAPPPAAIGNGVILTIYAIGLVAFGLIQRRMRWNDICKGVRWHTYSTGLSYFEFLPFSTYVVHRFVDPVVCFVAGMIVGMFSTPLGMWIMFSAVALGFVEQATFQKALERDLDVLDSMFESEVQGEVVQHFDGGNGPASQKPLNLADTAGIPTGLAPDIKRQIAIRQKRAPLAVAPAPAQLLDGLTYSPGVAPAQDDQAPGQVVAVAVVSVGTTTDEAPARRAPDNLA